MANDEHVEIVRQGADAIRQWRESHDHKHFDLSGANLGGVDLREADFGTDRGASLSEWSLCTGLALCGRDPLPPASPSGLVARRVSA